MAPTRHVCTFENRFEIVNHIMVPRWASANCARTHFFAGMTFVVFIISTPTGYHSNEPREHWQPTMFYETDDGSTLYTATYSTQTPGVHDQVTSYYDDLLWLAYGGDVQGSPSLGLLQSMMLLSNVYALATLAIEASGGKGYTEVPLTATMLAVGTVAWILVAILLSCCKRSCTFCIGSLLVGHSLMVFFFALALPTFHGQFNDGIQLPASPASLFILATASLCSAGLLFAYLGQQNRKIAEQPEEKRRTLV